MSLPLTVTIRFQANAMPPGVTLPADVVVEPSQWPHTGDRIRLKQSEVPSLTEQADLVDTNMLPGLTDSLGEHWRHVNVGGVVHEYTNTDHLATVYVSWPADVTEQVAP
jgi:hypothetical protein